MKRIRVIKRALKKEAPPAVLGGEIILEMLWKPPGSVKCLELHGLGDSSRTLDGNSRKRSESVSGIFPDFLPASHSRTGGMAQICEPKTWEPEIRRKALQESATFLQRCLCKVALQFKTFGDRKSLPIAKTHPKPSQEFLSGLSSGKSQPYWGLRFWGR